MISERIERVYENIERICRSLGRNPEEITVVAVTKYTGTEEMRQAVLAGMKHVGENRVQDAREKFLVLNDSGLSFSKHLIGHLQTNKVKLAVELFDMIQSVDSLKVAQAINTYAGQCGKVMDILIQVNASQEVQKSGVSLQEALSLVEQAGELPHLRVCGLMTIGPLTDDRQHIAECFQEVSKLYHQAAAQHQDHARIDMKYLSMGMTQDYDIAIENGSNMVRIGSEIFA